MHSGHLGLCYSSFGSFSFLSLCFPSVSLSFRHHGPTLVFHLLDTRPCIQYTVFLLSFIHTCSIPFLFFRLQYTLTYCIQIFIHASSWISFMINLASANAQTKLHPNRIPKCALHPTQIRLASMPSADPPASSLPPRLSPSAPNPVPFAASGPRDRVRALGWPRRRPAS
jgi:hypothetical protein